MKKNLSDKKKRIRETNRLTLPPRLEGRVKNVKMNPVRKTKKTVSHSRPVAEPVYLAGENGYEEYEDDEYLINTAQGYV